MSRLATRAKPLSANGVDGEGIARRPQILAGNPAQAPTNVNVESLQGDELAPELDPSMALGPASTSASGTTPPNEASDGAKSGGWGGGSWGGAGFGSLAGGLVGGGLGLLAGLFLGNAGLGASLGAGAGAMLGGMLGSWWGGRRSTPGTTPVQDAHTPEVDPEQPQPQPQEPQVLPEPQPQPQPEPQPSPVVSSRPKQSMYDVVRLARARQVQAKGGHLQKDGRAPGLKPQQGQGEPSGLMGSAGGALAKGGDALFAAAEATGKVGKAAAWAGEKVFGVNAVDAAKTGGNIASIGGEAARRQDPKLIAEYQQALADHQARKQDLDVASAAFHRYTEEERKSKPSVTRAYTQAGTRMVISHMKLRKAEKALGIEGLQEWSMDHTVGEVAPSTYQPGQVVSDADRPQGTMLGSADRLMDSMRGVHGRPLGNVTKLSPAEKEAVERADAAISALKELGSAELDKRSSPEAKRRDASQLEGMETTSKSMDAQRDKLAKQKIADKKRQIEELDAPTRWNPFQHKSDEDKEKKQKLVAEIKELKKDPSKAVDESHQAMRGKLENDSVELKSKMSTGFTTGEAALLSQLEAKRRAIYEGASDHKSFIAKHEGETVSKFGRAGGLKATDVTEEDTTLTTSEQAVKGLRSAGRGVDFVGQILEGNPDVAREYIKKGNLSAAAAITTAGVTKQVMSAGGSVVIPGVGMVSTLALEAIAQSMQLVGRAAASAGEGLAFSGEHKEMQQDLTSGGRSEAQGGKGIDFRGASNSKEERSNTEAALAAAQVVGEESGATAAATEFATSQAANIQAGGAAALGHASEMANSVAGHATEAVSSASSSVEALSGAAAQTTGSIGSWFSNLF